MPVKIVSDFTVDSTWSCSIPVLDGDLLFLGGKFWIMASAQHISRHKFVHQSRGLRSPRKLSMISLRCENWVQRGHGCHWCIECPCPKSGSSLVWCLALQICLAQETVLKLELEVASEKKGFNKNITLKIRLENIDWVSCNLGQLWRLQKSWKKSTKNGWNYAPLHHAKRPRSLRWVNGDFKCLWLREASWEPCFIYMFLEVLFWYERCSNRLQSRWSYC